MGFELFLKTKFGHLPAKVKIYNYLSKKGVLVAFLFLKF
jgi:hypothetical protein